jgi:hypothetical protein
MEEDDYHGIEDEEGGRGESDAAAPAEPAKTHHSPRAAPAANATKAAEGAAAATGEETHRPAVGHGGHAQQ